VVGQSCNRSAISSPETQRNLGSLGKKDLPRFGNPCPLSNVARRREHSFGAAGDTALAAVAGQCGRGHPENGAFRAFRHEAGNGGEKAGRLDVSLGPPRWGFLSVAWDVTRGCAALHPGLTWGCPFGVTESPGKRRESPVHGVNRGGIRRLNLPDAFPGRRGFRGCRARSPIKACCLCCRSLMRQPSSGHRSGECRRASSHTRSSATGHRRQVLASITERTSENGSKYSSTCGQSGGRSCKSGCRVIWSAFASVIPGPWRPSIARESPAISIWGRSARSGPPTGLPIAADQGPSGAITETKKPRSNRGFDGQSD